MDRHGLLMSALSAGPELLSSLLEQAPAHLLKVRPSTGSWSIHEHAVHLPHIEQRLADRRALLLGEHEPELSSWEPGEVERSGGYLGVDLDEAMERHRKLREATLAELEELTPDQWGRTAQHAEYAHYSIFTMHRHMLLHEQLHMTRIEELSLDRQRLDLLASHANEEG